MRYLFPALFALVLGWAAPAVVAAPEAVTLKAADGVEVFGEYSPVEKSKALVLLFHQAGSNRGEYAPIVPKLNAEGYSTLAIDQRSGGNYFGRSNQTVKKLGHSAEYLDALPDLEAALAWGVQNAHGAPVLVWGSSYSSSLVFLLAAKHPAGLAGLLSFSPGEYLGGGDTVRRAAAKVEIPVFVTSAKDAEEIGEARKIVESTASSAKTQFIPKVGGVHGSSTLRDDRNAKGAAENWQAVLAFLATVH